MEQHPNANNLWHTTPDTRQAAPPHPKLISMHLFRHRVAKRTAPAISGTFHTPRADNRCLSCE